MNTSQRQTVKVNGKHKKQRPPRSGITDKTWGQERPVVGETLLELERRLAAIKPKEMGL